MLEVGVLPYKAGICEPGFRSCPYNYSNLKATGKFKSHGRSLMEDCRLEKYRPKVLWCRLFLKTSGAVQNVKWIFSVTKTRSDIMPLSYLIKICTVCTTFRLHGFIRKLDKRQ